MITYEDSPARQNIMFCAIATDRQWTVEAAPNGGTVCLAQFPGLSRSVSPDAPARRIRVPALRPIGEGRAAALGADDPVRRGGGRLRDTCDGGRRKGRVTDAAFA